MIYVYTKSGKQEFTSTDSFVSAHKIRCMNAWAMNPYLRDEIRDFPVVDGLCGPMYDGKDEFGGTKVRYEDLYTNRMMSI